MMEQRERRSAAEMEEHASDSRDALRETLPGLVFGVSMLLLLLGCVVYALISLS